MIKIIVLLGIILQISHSEPSEQKIDFYIGRDHNQKHNYTFEDNVIKVQIVREKNEPKAKESICEIKKQKMQLKTQFNNDLMIEDKGDASNYNEELFKFILIQKYKEFFVAVRKNGDIAIFQMKDNNLNLISYTQSYTPPQQTSQTLIEVFLQDDFIYLISENKDAYYLKSFLILNVYKLKSAYEEPQQIFENKLNGKMMCTKLKGEYLYMLNKYFLLFVIQIEPVYKNPKVFRKIYISNMFQPHSFDFDDEKLYMIDEEKGIFEFKLSDIHQVSTKTEFYLKGDSIYNKSKSGMQILKPFNGEEYYVIIGKQNHRNYIAEVQNENTISTSDDEPVIKKIYINQSYIIFITEDNIHIIYRGIEESVVKSSEKQYTFEVIGVEDIYLDQKDDNLIFAITSNHLIQFQIQRTQSSVTCFKNERIDVSEEKHNKYVISYITSKCNDNSVRYCQHEIEMNAYIGKSNNNSDTEAFIIGLFFGIGLIFVIIIIYFIKKKKIQKTEKYNSFHNEQEQDIEQVDQQDSNNKT